MSVLDAIQRGVEMAPTPDYAGRPVQSIEGVRLGRVDAVIYDPASALTWLVVNTARIGARHTLVPLEADEPALGGLRTQASREAVAGAPRLIGPSTLTGGQSLSGWYRHYAGFGHAFARDRSGGRPYVVDVNERATLELTPGDELG